MFTGKSIREMRKRLGLKQIELAKKAGIDRSRLSTAENGHTQLRADELRAIQSAIASAARQKIKHIGKMGMELTNL